jgi:hypothetical protein
VQLDADLTRAEQIDVLETENPAWDEPTTGTLAVDGFYYIADSQLNSTSTARETIVLRIPY